MRLDVGRETSSSEGRVGGGGVAGVAGGEERFGNDAERVACEGAVNTIEALGGLAFPFDNGGSSLLDADSSLENTNIDSRSDGAALTLLPLAGATLLTILGPKTLGFRSSFTNPFPTVASEAVDRFASATSPTVSGFRVSSELRGETVSGYIPGRACTTRS